MKSLHCLYKWLSYGDFFMICKRLSKLIKQLNLLQITANMNTPLMQDLYTIQLLPVSVAPRDWFNPVVCMASTADMWDGNTCNSWIQKTWRSLSYTFQLLGMFLLVSNIMDINSDLDPGGKLSAPGPKGHQPVLEARVWGLERKLETQLQGP